MIRNREGGLKEGGRQGGTRAWQSEPSNGICICRWEPPDSKCREPAGSGAAVRWQEGLWERWWRGAVCGANALPAGEFGMFARQVRTKTFMQRGADLSFLSAFPAEAELLYPPCPHHDGMSARYE